MTKKRSNVAMLRLWLEKSMAERARPVVGKDGKNEKRWAKPGDLTNASHMQSMATLLAREAEALSFGSGECELHTGRIAGACPVCEGLWPEEGRR